MHITHSMHLTQNIFSMFYVSPALNFTGPSPVCGSISLVIRIVDTPGVSRNIISGLISSKYLNSGVNVAKYRQVRNAISHSEIVDVRWAPYICKDIFHTPLCPLTLFMNITEYDRFYQFNLSADPEIFPEREGVRRLFEFAKGSEAYFW